MYFVRPVFIFILLAICALDIGLTFVLPHQIAYEKVIDTALWGLAFALACAAFLRVSQSWEAQRPRLATTARILATLGEAMALTLLIVISLRTMDHLSKGTAMPLADDWLAKVDQMLGFDWRAYFDFVRLRPALHAPMAAAYDGLNTAIAILLLALAVTGQHRKVRLFAEAAIVCALISLIGGALFPAFAAAAYWIPDFADPATYAGYQSMPGVYFVDTIAALRQLDTPIHVWDGPLVGLVTVPSLHAGLGVLMIAVAWRTWLFVPTLAYGLVMIAATPIWGGHYVTDLIVGTVMALGTFLALDRGLPAMRPGTALVSGAPDRWPLRAR